MSKTFYLSTLNLPAGIHEIRLKARANNFTDSDPSNKIEYYDTMILSGTWIFNEVITLPSYQITQSINFTSYYADSSTIYTSFKYISAATYCLWYNTSSGTSIQACYGTNSWDYPETRTVVFEDNQVVSKEFYDWFTANAVPSDTQLLTVVNSNNTSETTTFTMPGEYTFGDLIFDTTLNANKEFALVSAEFVSYNGYGLYSNSDLTSKTSYDQTASGTFYYAGTTGSVTHSG